LEKPDPATAEQSPMQRRSGPAVGRPRTTSLWHILSSFTEKRPVYTPLLPRRHAQSIRSGECGRGRRRQGVCAAQNAVRARQAFMGTLASLSLWSGL